MKHPKLRVVRIRYAKVSNEEIQRQFFKVFDLLGVDEELLEIIGPKRPLKPPSGRTRRPRQGS